MCQTQNGIEYKTKLMCLESWTLGFESNWELSFISCRTVGRLSWFSVATGLLITHHPKEIQSPGQHLSAAAVLPVCSEEAGTLSTRELPDHQRPRISSFDHEMGKNLAQLIKSHPCVFLLEWLWVLVCWIHIHALCNQANFLFIFKIVAQTLQTL